MVTVSETWTQLSLCQFWISVRLFDTQWSACYSFSWIVLLRYFIRNVTAVWRCTDSSFQLLLAAQKRGICNQNVCPSVHLSHLWSTPKRWTISKKNVLHHTIKRYVSSFLTPNFAVLNLGFTSNECVKHPCRQRKYDKESAISQKQCKIRCKLVLITRNRWPWMTLNGVIAVILRSSTEFRSFGVNLHQSGWS